MRIANGSVWADLQRFGTLRGSSMLMLPQLLHQSFRSAPVLLRFSTISNFPKVTPALRRKGALVPMVRGKQRGIRSAESTKLDVPDLLKSSAKSRRTRSKSTKTAANPVAKTARRGDLQELHALPTAIPELAQTQQPKKGNKHKRANESERLQSELLNPASEDENSAPKCKSARTKKESSSSALKKKSSAVPKRMDPEAEEDEPASEDEVKAALSRPPPVNSDYLPLPWKGRLGYACLNTYLRSSNPPVFSSRTCRIQSILDHRHPLQHPDEPEHPTKNRPDKNKPPSVERGKAYVETLGLANAKDIVKMLRWNEKYGIKFLRLSSEMFPFASHKEYGYKLAPFAAEALAAAGKVAAELGHRLTTHPGQFTQLGSPRKEVIDNAIRDLTYHAELLSLLKLPPQQNRDAVMILHLGGVFGDKEATLNRFRENYTNLAPGIKKRLVLENDDVSWSVHDLLPVCEELNIPFVLDFHHNNIVFDETQIREGTKDIVELFPRIIETWRRKKITPKMHYSEPRENAFTPHQRRKHSPRVARLPPCPPDMDLMIEAKDKEQAVFELMRTYKLPGHELFKEMTPHVRHDVNTLAKSPKKKKTKKTKEEEDVYEADSVVRIPDEEVGMGGPFRAVYWPLGMEEWLRPSKRSVQEKVRGEEAEGEEIM